MQTFKIEHAYGCGSIGELFVEADTEEQARKYAAEDYNLTSDDIFNVEPITIDKAA